MIRGCLAQAFGIFIIGSLILWVFRAPESVAGLFISAVGLLTEGGDAIGRLVSAFTPAIDGLL
ncbi:hypothetical protein [Nocardiopsis sp. RV163]|jgi:hypothetical protein|uniref:hypothetical protein n=1 Tax=Nocardiopsis sp. RV163 TaxID=1661388 RepID=UPI00064BDF16|nr:hypothetical protein [Nocardiopsis sp. RV163]